MKYQKKNIRQYNRGQVMITLVILFMMVSLIIIFGVITPTLKNIKTISDLFKSKQSFFVADSGLADAIYRVKGSITISNQESLQLVGAQATTTIIDTIDGKTIITTGDYLNYARNTAVELSKGVGVSFFYGVQVGNGGIKMDGSARVNGNVYSNGQIDEGTITGSAISATTTIIGIEEAQIGTSGVGDAWAYNIQQSNVAGILKCQTGSGNGVGRNCDTTYGIPPALPLPISAEQIADWKSEATTTVINGNYTSNSPVSLGPVKITGNLTVKNDITMTGTIWVEGVLSFSGSSSIILSTTTYGGNSAVIIVDKYASFSGSSQIHDTGVPGSYVMLLVTSDCPQSTFCSNNKAISASGSSGSILLAAPYGTVSFSGSSHVKGVIADKMIMSGSSEVNYETGLVDMNFISGPTGSWNIKSFKETE